MTQDKDVPPPPTSTPAPLITSEKKLVYVFFWALICAIVMTTIFLKSSEFQERTLTIFGLILFSMYIVYNTNNILLKYRNGNIDCIRGAVDYYLDIINIFIRTINR